MFAYLCVQIWRSVHPFGFAIIVASLVTFESCRQCTQGDFTWPFLHAVMLTRDSAGTCGVSHCSSLSSCGDYIRWLRSVQNQTRTIYVYSKSRMLGNHSPVVRAAITGTFVLLCARRYMTNCSRHAGSYFAKY
eukprot:3239454-Pleurochrysis_carterae.AAC.1